MEAGYIERWMPYDIESISDRQCYVCIHFIEVSTATKSDVESGHHKKKTFVVLKKLNVMHLIFSYASYRSL